MHLLDILKEIDITNKYLNNAMTINKENTQSVNPLDYFFKILKINLK